MSFRYVPFIAAALVSAEQAHACPITDLLSGSSEATAVENEWDGSTFKTYLIRNAMRDENGVLNNWIKLELIPQRWGFDLEFPNGKRFAQVTTVSGEWVLSAYPGFMDACAYEKVTLRKGTGGRMDILNRSRKIGSVERFPFDEF